MYDVLVLLNKNVRDAIYRGDGREIFEVVG